MNLPSADKLLAIYSGVLTAAVAAALLTGAMRTPPHKATFEAIDVQRINLVEPDGTLRMVMTDAARAPGVIIKGKEYPHPGGRKDAGLIFFNAEGSENGGLTFGGGKAGGAAASSNGHLSFDNYEQDQVMVIEGAQTGERKSSFLSVWDRPEYSLEDFLKLMDENKTLPEDQRRALLERYLAGKPASQPRLFLGRREDRSVDLSLKDTEGRNRIVIRVAADGTPSLQFFDANGAVLSELPPRLH